MAAQLQLFDVRDPVQPWTVRVSRRARRLSVRVYPGGRVEVVAPPGVSPAVVQRFVGTHRRWIDERVADLSAADDPQRGALPACIDLRAVDRRFEVRYQPTDSRTLRLDFDTSASALHVRGPVQDERLVVRALREWLLELALHELGRELRDAADAGAFRYQRLQVRRQRTRWGSCSASGAISLNVCVLFLERAVMRYLLIHELSHTRHMNHSAQFWALVARHEPDYRRLDRELSRGWRSVPAWVFA